jgi:hypothetical protein
MDLPEAMRVKEQKTTERLILCEQKPRSGGRGHPEEKLSRAANLSPILHAVAPSTYTQDLLSEERKNYCKHKITTYIMF